MGLLVVCANWHSPAKTNSWDTPFSSSQTQHCLWLHMLVTAESNRLQLLVLALLLTMQGSCSGNRLRELIQPKITCQKGCLWNYGVREEQLWLRDGAMLGQHFLQSKAQGNPGITTQPKRQVLRSMPVTVLMNTGDREYWPSKEAFRVVKAPKDCAINIASPMLHFFPLQSQVHLIKRTPNNDYDLKALE